MNLFASVSLCNLSLNIIGWCPSDVIHKLEDIHSLKNTGLDRSSFFDAPLSSPEGWEVYIFIWECWLIRVLLLYSQEYLFWNLYSERVQELWSLGPDLTRFQTHLFKKWFIKFPSSISSFPKKEKNHACLPHWLLWECDHMFVNVQDRL